MLPSFKNQKYPEKFQDETIILLKEILGSLKNIDAGIQRMHGDQPEMLLEPAATPNTIQIIADLDSQGDQEDLLSQIAQLQAELKEQIELYQDQTSLLYEAREDLQSALNRKEELKKELVRKREELEDCLADLAQTKTRLDEKTREAQALTAALDDSRVELEHKDNKLKECVIALEQQSRELQESKAVAADARLRAEQMGAELAKAFAGNEQLQGSMLPEQTNLLQIWQKLQALPQSIREIAALYYNFNELSVFLTQCGQFALLRECWQSCMKKALNGANPEGMAEFLELVLQIYNRAFPDNPCKIITAEPQSAFNIMEHDRMGPMGSAVIKMLLPGLIKPNGEIACKCLVTLV